MHDISNGFLKIYIEKIENNRLEVFTVITFHINKEALQKMQNLDFAV